jgi:hypothetical protein
MVCIHDKIKHFYMMVCIHDKIKQFYMMVCIHDKISYEHKPRPRKKICVSTNILIEIG